MHHHEHHGLEELDLHTIIMMLKRHRFLIIRTVLLFMVIGIIFAILQTPMYSATATLQFNTRKQQIVDIESVVSGLSQDEKAIQSEVDILTSRTLLKRVYKKLNLQDNPEFSIELDDDLPEEEKALRQDTVITGRILKNLTIEHSPKSYTVHIQFASLSPETATNIANTLVNEYITSQLEAKYAVTEQANSWLNDKVRELREKVHKSELAVQQFKEKYDLIEVNGSTVRDKQLLELNSQLTLVQASRAQAEAKLKQVNEVSLQQVKDAAANIKGMQVEAISEVLNAPIIHELRVKEAELLQRKSELGSRYGDKHPTMIKVNAELKDIRRSIETEVGKIIDSIKNDLDVAAHKEETLQQKINSLQKHVEVNKRYEVELAELTREMESNIAVYEAFLARFKETSESHDKQEDDVRIVSYAEVPLSPYWPKKKLIVLIAGVLGGLFAVILAFFMEYMDKGFRNVAQVEKVTGLTVAGMVPEVKVTTPVIDYAIDNLTSVYSESLRTILTHIHFSNPDKKIQTILVTSSIPKEGKSIFSTSLARLVAKSGSKVLLVDCDMRLPSVHKHFHIKPSHTLVDYLMGDDALSLENITKNDPKTGMDYICATADTPHSQKLITSQKMKQFIEQAKQHYDYIILDAPPVMALADSLLLSELTDSTLMLARWEVTHRSITSAAVKKFKENNIPIAGIVLSRVDLKKYERYEYGDTGNYYSDYVQYYSDT